MAESINNWTECVNLLIVSWIWACCETISAWWAAKVEKVSLELAVDQPEVVEKEGAQSLNLEGEIWWVGQGVDSESYGTDIYFSFLFFSFDWIFI